MGTKAKNSKSNFKGERRSAAKDKAAFWEYSEARKRFLVEMAGELAALEKLNLSFCKMLLAHMDGKCGNKAAFYSVTGLSEKFCERIRKGEIHKPAPETVMRLCVKLALWGSVGEALFEAAGYKLTGALLAYKKILHSFQGEDIYEIDAVLTRYGLPSILLKSDREGVCGG
jgi:hypothetical protein